MPVFAARMRDNTPCVLKVARAGTDWLDHEARSLELEEGHGAVRLLEADQECILLKRALPGEPLASLFRPADDDVATQAIAPVMALGHVPIVSDRSFGRCGIASRPRSRAGPSVRRSRSRR
jgi:streptomycin 6-kinase